MDGTTEDARGRRPAGPPHAEAPGGPTGPGDPEDPTVWTPVTGPDPLDPATTFHDFSARTIRGEEHPMSLHRGRLVLVVNTATRCGFSPQLEGLQALHEEFSDRGLVVLGFPSDQFRQEPGEDEEIEKVCTSGYDVDFPLFSKVDVNGPGSLPLFTWLRAQRGGVLGGRIAWNFTKFLVGPDGRVLRRYAPPVPPARIARRIRAELGPADDPAPSP